MTETRPLPPLDDHVYSSPQSVEENSAEAKAIDDWLPITSSRNAKWWVSTVHNVTAIVGVGVLGLPFAMAQLGWGPGMTVLVLSWIISLYTFWQMTEMHEMVPGKRFNRYHELGQHAFGKKLGLWIVVPQQLVVEVGVDIVYMIAGGELLLIFHNSVCKDCKYVKLTYFIMIFASAHFVLSQLPSFNSLSGVSLTAAVMSICYSTIAWGAQLAKGVQDDVQYGYKSGGSSGSHLLSFFNALGYFTLVYGGHNIALEIQSTMPSTPQKPSKRAMWKGVVIAYIIVALCFFPVAIIGYWTFGNQVKGNILIQLRPPRWLFPTAIMFVVVHLIGSYQLFAMPVFNMIESVLVKNLAFKPTWYLRFIARNTYVGFTMFIAIKFPHFARAFDFVGGFVMAPTTYFFPCIIWLAIHKPRRFSLSWFTNWVCIIIGVSLMVVAAIGGLKETTVKILVSLYFIKILGMAIAHGLQHHVVTN